MYRMNLELENDTIQRIINNYKKKVEYDHDRYHNKIKNDPELMEKRRELSREHYHNNKDKKKEYYQKNKERLRLHGLARYYKDDLDKLKKRYPLEYDLMIEYNIINIIPHHQIPSPPSQISQPTSSSSPH